MRLTWALPAGMGSQSRPQSALQGFGYSKERGHVGECCGGSWVQGAWRLGPAEAWRVVLPGYYTWGPWSSVPRPAGRGGRAGPRQQQEVRLSLCCPCGRPASAPSRVLGLAGTEVTPSGVVLIWGGSCGGPCATCPCPGSQTPPVLGKPEARPAWRSCLFLTRGDGDWSLWGIHLGKGLSRRGACEFQHEQHRSPVPTQVEGPRGVVLL